MWVVLGDHIDTYQDLQMMDFQQMHEGVGGGFHCPV